MAAIIVRLQKFQKFYERALETSPIITKCITAGIRNLSRIDMLILKKQVLCLWEVI